MGPQRDMIGELADAVVDAWMVFGASSHRAEHWLFFERRHPVRLRRARSGVRATSTARRQREPRSQPTAERVPRRLAAAHASRSSTSTSPQVLLLRLVDRASPPSSRTCGGSPRTTTTAPPSGAARSRSTTSGRPFAPEARRLRHRARAMGGIRAEFWQTDTSVSHNSWGYVENQDYKRRRRARRRPGRHRHQERRAAAEHRAEARRHHPRGGAALLRGSAAGWPSTARRSTAPGRGRFGEGPTEVVAGSFADSRAPEFTAEDIRFTTRTDVTGDYVYATLLAHPEDGVAPNPIVWERRRPPRTTHSGGSSARFPG